LHITGLKQKDIEANRKKATIPPSLLWCKSGGVLRPGECLLRLVYGGQRAAKVKG